MTALQPPPSDMESMELAEALAQEPRPTDCIDWPGDAPKGFERIRFVIPPEGEYASARLAAHVRMKAVTKPMGIEMSEWTTEALASVLNDLVTKETLVRVMHHEKPINGAAEKGLFPYRKCFHSSADIEKALTKDVIEVLFNQWILTEYRLGPRFANMSEEDVFNWVAKLKEGLGPLGLLALPELVGLIHGLVTLVDKLLSNGSANPESQQTSLPGTLGCGVPPDSATPTSFSGEQHD